jgi:hypothetical protein
VLQITDNVSNMYGFQDRRAELAGLYKQAAPRHSVYDVLFNAALGQGTFGASTFYLLLQACLQWLTDSSVSAQLAGAGYGSLASAAVQSLQPLAVSVGKLRYAPSTDPAPYTALATQLQETGQCLSSFAVPRGCNNPGCINTSRTLEASLVAGASTKCSPSAQVAASRATAARPVRRRSGSSTSPCARPWLQRVQQRELGSCFCHGLAACV